MPHQASFSGSESEEKTFNPSSDSIFCYVDQSIDDPLGCTKLMFTLNLISILAQSDPLSLAASICPLKVQACHGGEEPQKKVKSLL